MNYESSIFGSLIGVLIWEVVDYFRCPRQQLSSFYLKRAGIRYLMVMLATLMIDPSSIQGAALLGFMARNYTQ